MTRTLPIWPDVPPDPEPTKLPPVEAPAEVKKAT